MPDTEFIDTQIDIHTPERVSFSVLLCGPFARLCAALIDGIFLMMLLAVLQFALLIITGAAESSFGIFLAAMFFMEWGYKIFCEIVFHGKTPGKSILGMRVMSADGGPLRPSQAVVRNLVRAFEGLVPFGFLPALLSMCLTRRFQRLGDLAGGTIVVWDHELPNRRQKTRSQKQNVQLEKVMELLPARLELGGKTMRLVDEYVRYRNKLSRERLDEISAPLSDQLRRSYNIPQEVPADLLMVAISERSNEYREPVKRSVIVKQ